MFKDEDCIQISGLQHLAFCPRRWGLIYLEQEWQENILTAEGRKMHERVDSAYKEFRKGLKQYSGLYVKSNQLGIYGRTDLVEAIKDESCINRINTLGLNGKWRLYPVEFKRGKAYSKEADLIQLCAQALCLEEMTDSSVPFGAVFYGQTRKRLEVQFDEGLRSKTKELISTAHALLQEKILPDARFYLHCRSCSMIDVCMPKKLQKQKLDQYREELLGEAD